MKCFMMFFMLFLTYSIIGWALESTANSIEIKKFINRGFLIGPYCPVYGVGAIIIILSLNAYCNDFIVLFILSILICSIVEYFASYLMEKIFNARWWDYSQTPFNINGRICLGNSVFFGLGGLIIIKINPYIQKFYNSFTPEIFDILFGICFAIFIIDFIVSFKIINKLKMTSLELKKDSTGEITDKVKKVLYQKSEDFKRLLFAFPNVKFNVKLPKKKNKK